MGEELIFAISVIYGFAMFVIGYCIGHKDAKDEGVK